MNKRNTKTLQICWNDSRKALVLALVLAPTASQKGCKCRNYFKDCQLPALTN